MVGSTDRQPPHSQRFPRQLRLATSAEFQRVLRHRCSTADETLIVYAAAREEPLTRLGLSVSRRVGHAVQRNRWKRAIREVFRRNRASIPAGFDFVVIPRRDAVFSFAAIDRSLPQLMARAARKAASREQARR